MVHKIVQTLTVLALLVSVESTVFKKCNYWDFDDGESLLDCDNRNVRLYGRDGQLVETIVYKDERIQVLQYPNKPGNCYVVDMLRFPRGEGVEEVMEPVKANNSLSEEVKNAAPHACYGTVFFLLQRGNALDQGTDLARGRSISLNNARAARHKRQIGLCIGTWEYVCKTRRITYPDGTVEEITECRWVCKGIKLDVLRPLKGE